MQLLLYNFGMIIYRLTRSGTAKYAVSDSDVCDGCNILTIEGLGHILPAHLQFVTSVAYVYVYVFFACAPG
jgi:hypothetical protein